MSSGAVVRHPSVPRSITVTPMKRMFSFDYRHPRVMARIRVAIGIWLLFLTAILCAYTSWWGLVLVVPAALHFYLAYRLSHDGRS